MLILKQNAKRLPEIKPKEHAYVGWGKFENMSCPEIGLHQKIGTTGNGTAVTYEQQRITISDSILKLHRLRWDSIVNRNNKKWLTIRNFTKTKKGGEP